MTAAALLREVGLMADGPLPWGRPVPARSAGVFLVELPAPLARAPIELTRVGKWVERVPDLRLDGEHPTSKALASRIGAFWLPSQVVLYIGATDRSIGGRLSAMDRTALGDRRPHSGGHWLHVLRTLPSTRMWWAATDAVEEYEDALHAAFAASIEPTDLAAQAALAPPDGPVILPFANLRRPTGERRPSGIAGALLPEPVEAATPPTHLVVVPDGDADGARREAPTPIRRAPPLRPSAAAASRQAGRPKPRSSGAANVTPGAPQEATLTADGAARMRDELDELIAVRRPEVIGRIRSAKELGDLKENADYTAAREEQSFLEGRIQALEGRLRDAVIASVAAAGARSGADFGSTVTVEIDGITSVYTLVGTAEADPSAGRLSVASPVGRALLGASAGSIVQVETPRGRTAYTVVAVE